MLVMNITLGFNEDFKQNDISIQGMKRLYIGEGGICLSFLEIFKNRNSTKIKCNHKNNTVTLGPL